MPIVNAPKLSPDIPKVLDVYHVPRHSMHTWTSQERETLRVLESLKKFVITSTFKRETTNCLFCLVKRVLLTLWVI